MEAIDQKANAVILKWLEKNEGRWDEHDSSTVSDLQNSLKENGLYFCLAEISSSLNENDLKREKELPSGYMGYSKIRNTDGTISVFHNGKDVSDKPLPYLIDIDKFNAIEITEIDI